MVAGLQNYPNLTKTATSTINIRKYIPLCENTLTKTCFMQKKSFGVCEIISPLGIYSLQDLLSEKFTWSQISILMEYGIWQKNTGWGHILPFDKFCPWYWFSMSQMFLTSETTISFSNWCAKNIVYKSDKLDNVHDWGVKDDHWPWLRCKSRPFEIFGHVWMIIDIHMSELEMSWKYFHIQ